ncbi:MAG: TonB-dependent receptor [Betaproteobacteria bacterium HGW-Betaproteobacteria-6]|nr:MAG: TonB-dependent receptor [Betaproteobacteria bacterium HGW-Betaproteobacteria-6]
MPRKSMIAICLTALCTGTPVFADNIDEEDLALAYGDKATISLATGAKQSLRRAPAVATVITAENIAAMGATDIDEVLEAVPGLHVGRVSSMGLAMYIMRGVYGTNNPQVLMLQNGIPVTVAITNNKGNLWGGLPVENIARIEILRGPGSALYGADAFAGVINIITKTAEDIRGTQFGVRAGDYQRQDAWFQHGGQFGDASVAAFLRAGSTDGYHRTVESDASGRSGRVNIGQTAIDGSLDLAVGRWRWRSGYKLRDDMGTYTGIAQALDPYGQGRSERFTSDLSWTANDIAPNWRAGATVAFMHYKQTFTSPAHLLPPFGAFTSDLLGAPEFADRQWRLSAHATYAGFRNHQIRVGTGYDDIDLYMTREYRNFNYNSSGVPIPAAGGYALSPTPFILPQQRQVFYLYAQDEWNFARDWTLTAGVHHDHYSDFGDTTNPRLALVWDTAVNLTTKLMYGTAFRAPSFTEQYSTNNPIGQGNPTIMPEKSQTLELAFAWQARQDLQLNLSIFRYEMQDIIRTTAVAGGTMYNNTGQQHGTGYELEGIWEASRNLRLSGHYSVQKSIDENTGQDAGYAPHQQAYLRGDWIPAAQWMLSGQINHVADRQRPAGDTRPTVPDYTTLDLTLRTTSARQKGWNFAASVRNLFDADAREPSTYPVRIQGDLPGAPRTFWLQATYGL